MLRLNLDNDSSLSCDTKILRPVLNLKVPISHHAHSKCQIMIEINFQSPSEITRSKRPYFLASFWSACRLGKGQHKSSTNETWVSMFLIENGLLTHREVQAYSKVKETARPTQQWGTRSTTSFSRMLRSETPRQEKFRKNSLTLAAPIGLDLMRMYRSDLDSEGQEEEVLENMLKELRTQEHYTFSLANFL